MHLNPPFQTIEMFNEIAENKDDYAKFYEAFSKNLKLGEWLFEQFLSRSVAAGLVGCWAGPSQRNRSCKALSKNLKLG